LKEKLLLSESLADADASLIQDPRMEYPIVNCPIIITRTAATPDQSPPNLSVESSMVHNGSRDVRNIVTSISRHKVASPPVYRVNRTPVSGLIKYYKNIY